MVAELVQPLHPILDIDAALDSITWSSRTVKRTTRPVVSADRYGMSSVRVWKPIVFFASKPKMLRAPYS